MASKPLRPCRHAGCAELTRNGYCAKHRRDASKRIESAQWHGLYCTAEWKSMRQEQLLAEPFCRACAKQGKRTKATEVDHIQPHRGVMALFQDRQNLQSLCHKCHSAKTMREQNERRKLR